MGLPTDDVLFELDFGSRKYPTPGDHLMHNPFYVKKKAKKGKKGKKGRSKSPSKKK